MLRIFRHYVSGLAFVLFLGDVAVLFGAFYTAELATAWPGYGPFAVRFLEVAGVMALALYLGDLYQPRQVVGQRELVARVLVCAATAALAVAAIGFAVPLLRLARSAFLTIFLLSTFGLMAWRAALLGAWSQQQMTVRVLVLGTGQVGRLISSLESTSARPFRIIGFLDDDPAAADMVPPGHALLGKIQDLDNLVEETRPDIVVVAQIDRRGCFPTKSLLECRLRGIRVEDWPTFYEKAEGKILVTAVRPSWLIFSDGFVKTPRTEIIKRTFDLVVSLAGILLSLPLMILVAVAIKLESPGSILYRQPRLGQNGCVFILNKFRSMRQDAEKDSGPVWSSQRDPRITRVGSVLRRTRLDELPQLFNVLVGHMSFIGPRPERPEFVAELQKQIPYYMERLAVKPGVTGWAQVRYQYGSSVEDAMEKLQYDLYYIKNLSLFLDLLIVLNTLQVVLFARGR
ncbi:MAG TPA: TIGR03013 family XrtA/PEP-CTERM system glycosyltransferase [Methylomirabilota bacterium]|nr:TIGR03013 family XrtA/PEP-CTERM system glycosyltransferase [Methylomirabilota bacterium]